jgi:hypothetical protein
MAESRVTRTDHYSADEPTLRGMREVGLAQLAEAMNGRMDIWSNLAQSISSGPP